MRTLAYWLALLLVFTIPFEKIFTFGGRAGPTLTHYLGLFVAAFWVATMVVTDRFRKPRLFHVLVILFLLWNATSIFWTISLSFSTNRLTTYIQLVGLVLMLWDLFPTRAAVRALLQAYVLGGWVSVINTITNYVQGVTAHERIVRYAASGFNENELGLVLAVSMPMAWYLATRAPEDGRRSAAVKLTNFVYVPAALFCILLTASRGGLVCTLPAFLYILATLTRVRLFQRVFLFAALIPSLFLVFSLTPQSTYERFAATEEELEDGDLNGRSEVWLLGLQVFREHPVTGVGTGTFQAATELEKAAHNAYLSVLVEVGGVGFALFMGIIGMAVLHALSQPRAEAALWLAIILVWAIGVFALSLEYRKPTWLVLSLPVLAAYAEAWLPGPQVAARPAAAKRRLGRVVTADS